MTYKEPPINSTINVVVPDGTLHVLTDPMLQSIDPTSTSGRRYLYESAVIDPERASPTLSVGMFRDKHCTVGEDWLIAETSLEVYWSASLVAP